MIALAAALLLLTVTASVPALPELPAATPAAEVWALDQLRIDDKTDEKVLNALEPTHTIDAAIAVLKQYGVHYLRTRAVLLPERLPPDVRARIAALPEGEPFVLPEGGFISISVIVSRRPAPAGMGGA